MSARMFLDDVRMAPAGWTRVKTVDEAKELLQSDHDVTECSLDHDLGAVCEHEGTALEGECHCWAKRGSSPDGSGYDLVLWMIKNDRVPAKVWLHSWSPEGVKTMWDLLVGAGYGDRVHLQPWEHPAEAAGRRQAEAQ